MDPSWLCLKNTVDISELLEEKTTRVANLEGNDGWKK